MAYSMNKSKIKVTKDCLFINCYDNFKRKRKAKNENLFLLLQITNYYKFLFQIIRFFYSS